MRICFVGHAFHRRTGSSRFFVDLLRTLGSVDEYASDPDGDPAADDRLVEELASSRYDRYVFWQTEAIAERIAPLELGRSILVPMYDAAVTRPPDWWAQFVKPHFISFSRAHHEALQRIGCRTSYFQYFPDPGAEPAFDGAAGRRAFFWHRRPQGPITLRRVLRQCEMLGIDELLVHDVPDFATEPRAPTGSDGRGITIVRSAWFADRRELQRHAAQALFFFAPRPTEGIGMANLEAMARGQIVVAPDLPTINEYAAHRVSGILYDPKRPGDPFDLAPLRADQRHQLSSAARHKITTGRRMWLNDVDRLLSLIADDGRRWITTDYSSAFARHLRRAAHARIRHAK